MELYTLVSSAGLEVRIATLGAAIVSLKAPDASGVLADVVLGYDDLPGYIADESYFGAVVGRYANRIANGRFSLDGQLYQLACNDGPHHLHGGLRGFNMALWQATAESGSDSERLILQYVSPHLEEGYPGELSAEVIYTVDDANTLLVEYRATTDQPTPVSLTQHSYFNLSGDHTSDILNHELVINAAQYTPVDELLIPTGEMRSVGSTAFDYRTPCRIGSRMASSDPQLAYGSGYDHNFVLDEAASSPFSARVHDPRSGRVLEVHTTAPGLQFYSGNYLGDVVGRGGLLYPQWGGFCLEPQHFPNAPNCPSFPSAILRPGAVYESRSTYRFTAQR